MEEVITIKIASKGNGFFTGSVIVKDGDEIAGKTYSGSINKVWGACFERADSFTSWLEQSASPTREEKGPDPVQAILRAPGMAATPAKRLPHLKTRRKQIVRWMVINDLDTVTIDQLAEWTVHTIFPSRDEVAVYLDKMRSVGIFTKEFKNGKTYFTLNKDHAGVALVLDRMGGSSGVRVADAACPEGDRGVVPEALANPGLFGESFRDDGPPLVHHS